MIELTLHTDPAHGWAEVPLSLVDSLGIADKISHYSYTDGKNAYLEEDCDLAVLIKALKALDMDYHLTEKYSHNDSFIRRLERF